MWRLLYFHETGFASFLLMRTVIPELVGAVFFGRLLDELQGGNRFFRLPMEKKGGKFVIGGQIS